MTPTSRTSPESQADALVGAARVLATSSFVSVLDKHPFLRNCDVQQWEFFVAAACVFSATIKLKNLQFGFEHEALLMDRVATSMRAWDRQALDCFDDCGAFYESTFDVVHSSAHDDNARFSSADVIGSWIVWNIVRHAPTSLDEKSLARSIGTLVVHSFFDWWS